MAPPPVGAGAGAVQQCGRCRGVGPWPGPAIQRNQCLHQIYTVYYCIQFICKELEISVKAAVSVVLCVLFLCYLESLRLTVPCEVQATVRFV